MTWTKDSFAFADSFDETEGRYRGLRAMQLVPLASDDLQGLLVRPEIAEKQLEAERPLPVPPPPTTGGDQGPPKPHGGDSESDYTVGPGNDQPPLKAQPRRFYGTVDLDATRVGRDAGKIAEEVIAHLAGLVGARVNVTLEISAEVPAGVPDQIVRIVTENGRTLKFSSQGFEQE